ncbi:MAG: nucleotidyltransferase domain-containing protein [Nanoarchaeota archaeon]|nr:nucleotidyltransferase domain-containing protein [Nanoarchaeota archaeon]MBU1632031.1 nucleotidyltransferase domain-containing protein [Nanoarchaeota archaeon]MBU1875961.1 nucleotidyltransferase domain-containing protein [Nanoarchaeota archaeon]
MLKKYLKKTLESESKKFYLKNKDEVLDIIVFGSFVKGKEKPNDIDILLIFKDKIDLNLSHELKKSLEQKIEMKIEITSKTYFKLFDTALKIKESFLVEGYSLVNNKRIAEGLGFTNKILFHYSLKSKNKSERMQFYYGLHGRNTEGIINKLNAVKYTDTIILCPVENQEEMEEFFKNWKIEFKETPLLIPSRLL